MNILVTGGEGFIGSHIIDKLNSGYKNYKATYIKTDITQKELDLVFEKYKYKMLPVHRQERIGNIKHSILDNTNLCKQINFYNFTNIDVGLSRLIDDNLCVNSK